MSAIRDRVAQTMVIDAQKGRISIGDVNIAFHCDKFNTRIIKGFEDTLGYEKTRVLLFKVAEETTYDGFCGFLKEMMEGKSPIVAFSLANELFKTLGYGNFEVIEINGKVRGNTAYTAEGWIENQAKWGWERRKCPVCHFEAGVIAAAWEIIHGLPKGSASVAERACRAMGDPTCEFSIEVT